MQEQQSIFQKIISVFFIIIAVALEAGVLLALKYSIDRGEMSEIITFATIAFVPPIIFFGYLLNLIKRLIKKFGFQKIINLFQIISIYIFLLIICFAFEVAGVLYIIEPNSILAVVEGILLILLPIPFIIPLVKGIYSEIKIFIIGSDPRYFEYIQNNKTALGRYTRPVLSDRRRIILANKYVILDFDIISFSDGEGQIVITDKQNGILHKIFFEKQKIEMMHIFKEICEIFDYDADAEKFIKKIKNSNTKRKSEIKKIKNKKIYLDINKASEAELTALPGVTIAKAKRAIKMRKKYAFYLSVNQFYEAINLEEQFIEQITSNGTKILLNNLPEYKALEMKQEE